MKAPKNDLTDRERILTYLLAEAEHMSKLCDNHTRPTEERWPQWRYAEKGEPVAGQLVMAQTTAMLRPHPHAVAWCMGRGDPGPKYNEHDVPKIRAIDDKEWIWFFNESFSIYNGDSTRPVFLDGWKRQYYLKVLRAMRVVGNIDRYRFSAIKIDEKDAVLTVRPHVWFASFDDNDKGDKPFTIPLPASPTVLQRDLVAALKLGKFGTYWNK